MIISLLKTLVNDRRFRLAEVAAIVLLVVFVFLKTGEEKTLRKRLEAAEVSLQNPKVVERVTTLTRTGPVHIVYRLRELPSGEKETTTEETHAAVDERKSTDFESYPVSLDDLVGAIARTDRWLLTFGVNSLSKDFNGKGLLVGYGFRNRLDLQAGVLRTDRNEGWVLATLRF